MGKASRALGGAGQGAAAGAAVGGPYGAVIGGVVGGLGGLLSGGDDDDQAKALQAQALEQIRNLQIPSIEELKIQLEELKSQGKLTPEMEDTILQQASELKQIQGDPRLKEAQMGALNRLQKVGTEGLTAEDRLRLGQVTRTTAQDARARDEAILQNMAARGAGGSGSELAQRLISSQAQADRASQEGMNVAAQANQRALEGILKSGQLGGDIRTQDFSEAGKIAEAQDAVNRFNAANRQNVLSRNVGARNVGQEANLREAQRIADRNVALRNTQQEYNKNLVIDDYKRRLDKSKALSGALDTSAKQAQDRANASNQEFASTAQGLRGEATSAAPLFKSKPTLNNELDNEENDYSVFKGSR